MSQQDFSLQLFTTSPSTERTHQVCTRHDLLTSEGLWGFLPKGGVQAEPLRSTWGAAREAEGPSPPPGTRHGALSSKHCRVPCSMATAPDSTLSLRLSLNAP